jgi:hypothetical protein
LGSALHHVVVMMVTMVVVMAMVAMMEVVMVMHRGLGGDREGRDAHGDDGGDKKLLDHVRVFHSEC